MRSRKMAKCMCFATVAALFLLVNTVTAGKPVIAVAVAAVQILLFVFIDRFFKVESKTKKRMLVKYVTTIAAILVVTLTFIGIFFNDSYAVYMFDGTETSSSLLDTAVDTTPRLVYAFLQLLPVLMYAAIAFKKAYLFPAAAAFAGFGILANNTSIAFGPFSVVSATNDSVREYIIGSHSDKIAPAIAVLVIVSLAISVADLIMHPPKKKADIKNILLAAAYVLALVLLIAAIAAQISGKTFNIETLKAAVYSSKGLF